MKIYKSFIINIKPGLDFINKYKIFKNLYFELPVGSIIMFLVLYSNTTGIVPDFISLTSNKNVATYLTTIISSISSLTGFLIAILILAFEYYKKNLNKIYLKYFIANKALIFLINFYIFVFLFAGLSLLLLGQESPNSVGELTVCYISLISFLILIPSTFLLSFKLVKGLKVNDIIDEYLNKLSFDEVFLINVNNKIFPSQLMIKKQFTIVEIVDNDCLNVLQKMIINSLQNDNYIEAQLILNQISDKFISFIVNKSELEIKNNTNFHQYRYASFLLLLVSDSKLNPKFSARLIFDKVLELIEEFYMTYNEKKFKLSYIEPFRESTYTKLIRMSSENEDHIEQILKSIKNVIENTISKNLPEEEHIMYFDVEYRKGHNIKIENSTEDKFYESYYSWGKFLENYPEYFVLQINRTIEDRSEKKFLELMSIYKNCVFSFYWRLESTPKHLKSRWIIQNFMSLISLFKKAIEKDIIHKLNIYCIVSDTDIINLYTDNDICARIVLVDYLHFMIWLNEKGKLNYSVFCGIYSLGDWGKSFMGNNLTMLGSYFAKHYHSNERFENGIEDVLNTVIIIFNNYKNGTISEGVNYKTMIKVIETIKESYLNSRMKLPKSQKILRKLNRIIKEIKTEDKGVVALADIN